MTFDSHGRPKLWAKCWTCKHLLPGWQCGVWLYQKMRLDEEVESCKSYEPREPREEKK